MKNNISINQEKFISDLFAARNYFAHSSNKRDLKQDINEFIILNETLGLYTGKKYDINDIFCIKPDSREMIARNIDKKRKMFYDYFISNIDTLDEIGDNYNSLLIDSNIVMLPFFDKVKRFNEKDFKDIILGFFSEIDEKYYEVVKKYFDEDRISMGKVKLNNVGGFHASINSFNTGYIFTPFTQLDSSSAVLLVHELGHAIDSELFMNPQQKTLEIFRDSLLELPSTCFENMFTQYLIKNRIDETGGLIVDSSRVIETDDFFAQISDCTYALPPSIDEEDNVLTEDNILVNFREALIYGIAYIFAYNLYEVYKNDPKNFSKVFYNIISSRKECSLREIIDKTGISYEDFTSCSLIKDTICENNLKLRKRFNYNA